ncbi:MAG: hypothetical protein JW760_07160, partial [Spirochaetales bacterium]|nr:hypothetical protein [Spirochaetales bacterium]
MSKVSNGSILAALGISLLVLFGCATKPTDQPAEGDRLERWLYADEGKTDEEFPEETKPARVVPLETLTSPGLSSRSEEGLPAPAYRSFILEKPARVAIEAASDAGAEIILLDRSSGELARDGRVGQEDGRIDILLDAGEYRVEIRTLREEDPADLQVKEFVERPVNPGILSQSLPGTLHTETLKDYQACSFWITLEEDDETIILEALGRNLRDLVIWKDGLWRLPETFQLSEYAPQPGRTMGYTEVYLTPGAGNYLITLYGGKPRAWEEGSEEEPLYIRYGYKDLGSVVDAYTRISPMGRDAFLVSGEATVFEVENPDFIPVLLGVSESISSRRFYSQSRATLEKDSESTRAMLTVRPSDRPRLVFLQGRPGDTVRLRAIPSREYYYIEDPPKGGRYLVSSLSSLDADHSVDATAIVVRAGDGRTTRDEVVHSSHLTVTPEEPLHREINTRGEVTFVVNLTASGKWALLHGDDNRRVGAAFAPLRDLASVEEPVFLDENPATADLEAGIYLVMLWTDRPGILEYVLYYSGDRNPRGNEREARKLLEEAAPPPWQDITFITEKNEISSGTEHAVILNSRGGPLHALAVEELPLTLVNPVPLTLEGGESIDLPLLPHTRGSLSVGYGAIELRHRGQPLDETAVLEAEEITVTLRNTGSSPVTFVLRLDPVKDLIYNSPEVPDLLSLFPNLVPDKPVFFTCGRSETKHFILQTDRSGFFELQTTGRLTTRITVRTPVLPQGPRAESNGPGRNALVQGFFRPGTYLVAVETLGVSEGRAALVMAPLPLKDLGSLRENTWYRTSLDKGTGVTGTLSLREPGRFSFSSFGLYGGLPVRVEDTDGWPVLSDTYHPGVYRLYAWPQDVSHRRLTGYFRVPLPEELPEEGPWPLALNGSRRRVWMETPERNPQEFLLSSPATIPVELSLDGTMSWSIIDSQGSLWRKDSEGSSFELPAGEYRIRVKNREVGNRVPYTLMVRTRVLADGLEQQTATIPAEFPVVLDRSGICELWSFGSRDVRARLFTENGELELASGDDREGDWNFFLSRYLPAGRYRLVVEDSFSRSSRDVTIHCSLREEVWTEEQTLPLEEVLRIDKDIIGIPFSSGTGGLTVFSCDSSSILLSLYRGDKLLAEGTGEVVV